MPPVAAHDYVASSSLQPDVTHVDTLRKTKKKKVTKKKKEKKHEKFHQKNATCATWGKSRQ